MINANPGIHATWSYLTRFEKTAFCRIRTYGVCFSLLLGCANTLMEKYFDRSQEGAARTREVMALPNRATVYFFRQRAWAQAMIYLPMPPMYYVLDEQMLSVMPLG